MLLAFSPAERISPIDPMERRTRRRNSLSSCSIQTRSKTRRLATYFDFYFLDECWEFVFKFLINDVNSHGNNRLYFMCLSLVSKQFLLITNRIRLSLIIRNSTRPFLHCLLKRFTSLTSLNLTPSSGDLNKLLYQISTFPLKLTTLVLSVQATIPANGLRSFSQNITTLKLCKMNFKVPKLEVLNLLFTRVDDETLYIITKNCHIILQLLLVYCECVT